ncbi:MAG: hypothetical protein NTV00_07245 [Methylococcales bacterium]|nr:hypothetical protein [Methylococcales bacterium]
MLSLSTVTKTPLGIWALMGLMLATRAHSNHFGSAISLPDASLAVFFMAGLWFGGLRFFSVLLLEAALIDYVAISHMGVSDYCISPAYVFLIPTYAALFFAGRAATPFKTMRVRDLSLQLGLLVMASSVAFMISNSSFYVLSERFTDLNWMQYADRVAQYYVPYVSGALVYSVVIIATVRVLTSLSLTPSSRNKAI